MNVLIAGSRSIKKFDLSTHIPPEATAIISGGACGIDALAEEYADKKRLSKIIVRPNYSLYGKAAPLKRNETMVDMADFVLIVWDGNSKGTKFTADYAKKKNKEIKLVLFDGTDT